MKRLIRRMASDAEEDFFSTMTNYNKFQTHEDIIKEQKLKKKLETPTYECIVTFIINTNENFDINLLQNKNSSEFSTINNGKCDVKGLDSKVHMNKFTCTIDSNGLFGDSYLISIGMRFDLQTANKRPKDAVKKMLQKYIDFTTGRIEQLSIGTHKYNKI